MLLYLVWVKTCQSGSSADEFSSWSKIKKVLDVTNSRTRPFELLRVRPSGRQRVTQRTTAAATSHHRVNKHLRDGGSRLIRHGSLFAAWGVMAILLAKPSNRARGRVTTLSRKLVKRVDNPVLSCGATFERTTRWNFGSCPRRCEGHTINTDRSRSGGSLS